MWNIPQCRINNLLNVGSEESKKFVTVCYSNTNARNAAIRSVECHQRACDEALESAAGAARSDGEAAEALAADGESGM